MQGNLQKNLQRNSSDVIEHETWSRLQLLKRKRSHATSKGKDAWCRNYVFIVQLLLMPVANLHFALYRHIVRCMHACRCNSLLHHVVECLGAVTINDLALSYCCFVRWQAHVACQGLYSFLSLVRLTFCHWVSSLQQTSKPNGNSLKYKYNYWWKKLVFI